MHEVERQSNKSRDRNGCVEPDRLPRLALQARFPIAMGTTEAIPCAASTLQDNQIGSARTNRIARQSASSA